MGWIERVRRRLGFPRAHRDVEDEVEAELRFHITAYVEDLVRRGHSEEDARRKAVGEFGDMSAAQAELIEIDRRHARRVSRGDLLLDVLQDVRFAMRMTLRRPAFTVAAVLMLALGIGATTAIFSVVDAALLRPLPFEDPGRLAVIGGVAGPERDRRGASYPEISDWEALTQSFVDVSIYDGTQLNLSGDGEAEQLEAEMVSPGYFRLLGVSPQLGRGFLAEDDVPGAKPSVVISYSFWQRHYGGAPDILGRTVTLGEGPAGVGFTDTPAEIVGVMPDGFRGLSFDTEIWATMLPFAPGAGADDARGERWLRAIGRLRPGVSAESAQADLAAAARRLEALYPDTNRERSADLFSLHQYYLDSTRTLLIVLLAAVSLLLAVACVNVVNLQLVRGIARRGEVALRYALGAGKLRLVRQLTTEAMVLAALGGITGVALAYLGTKFLLALVPGGVLPLYVDASIDGRVLLFAAGMVVFTGVLSGIVPALRSTRHGFSGEVRASDRVAADVSAASGRLQRALVAVEVALAVALMAGGALMLRSLGEQLNVAPGFQPANVVAAHIDLTDDAYTPEGRILFAQQLIERLESMPGVAAATVGSDAPLRGGNTSAASLTLEGRPDEQIRYYRHRVSSGYFEALRIPLIRGRDFEPSDALHAPGVVIVSEAFAERLWPGRDPIGTYVRLGSSSDDAIAQVVGVAANVRFRDLTTDVMDPGEDPDVYFPYAQAPTRSLEILIRSATTELTGIGIMRGAVAELDPSIPVASVQPLEDALAAQTAPTRFGSFVLGIFAVLALGLSGIGLYGVMAFVVASRRREIAIRMALGAEPARELRMVVRQGMTLVAIGAVVGIGMALLSARLFSSLLYGVQPTDPAAITAVTAVLLATAALANAIPALRAVKTEPQIVLRGD